MLCTLLVSFLCIAARCDTAVANMSMSVVNASADLDMNASIVFPSSDGVLVSDAVMAATNGKLNVQTNADEIVRPGCIGVNWEEQWGHIRAANLAIQWVQNSKPMKQIQTALSSLKVESKFPFAFNIGGLNKSYHIEMTGSHVEIKGLNEITVKPIQALSNTELQARVEAGTFSVNLVGNLEVTPIDGNRSLPSNEFVRTNSRAFKRVQSMISLSLVKPTIQANVEIHMYRCAKVFSFGWFKCMVHSAWSYVWAFGTFRITKEIFGRMEYMHVHEISFDFEQTDVRFRLSEGDMDQAKDVSGFDPIDLKRVIDSRKLNGPFYQFVKHELSTQVTKNLNNAIEKNEHHMEGRCHRRR